MILFNVSTKNAAQTQALGNMIGRILTGGEVILLSGPLGAGKTTMVQGIAAGLDIKGRIQSPSFVLERIHHGRLTLRHLDFYRLGPQEIDDAGFFDDSGLLDDSGGDSTVTVIEWAERAAEIPPTTLKVHIHPVPGMADERTITVETQQSEWGDKIREAVKKSGISR